MDNTDDQTLTFTGTDLSISDGNSVDLSSLRDGTGTDNQDLELTGNTLSLTNDGTTVDLSSYLDNTDDQTLTFTGTDLSISNGNSIDLSSLRDGTGTDNQDLTSATLSGNTLTIGIENGTSATVDLSPILEVQQAQIEALQTQVAAQQTLIETEQALVAAQQAELTRQEERINDLITRVEAIESCACEGTLSNGGNLTANKNQPILYQNIPNPFNGTTSIKYYVPDTYEKAAIVFSNTSGQIIDTVHLKERGEKELYFNSASLPVGIYFYTLYVNNHKVATKKMIIE
ncbi:T9SS type A sorting domain-containing protein [Tenacibaculum amylolyticum]|uniref:T9SS type A sorting domain-containing protein n=1 Tax=Tenacibaculum amylolyticum TaxID=104269 RepID=UPI003895C188